MIKESIISQRYKTIEDLTGVALGEETPISDTQEDQVEQKVLKDTKGPKILIFDIETAPTDAYIWSLWRDVTSTDFIKSDWYTMSWSAKWLHETDKVTKSLPDYAGYNENPKDDKALLEDLWVLLDDCDIVIAHNGKKFDRRKVNARFVINGMKPPSPYKVIDTLLEARKNFMFTSNKLGDLGVYLGVGTKEATGGFSLWKRCIAKDPEAWQTMVDYNTRDITLLEDVYLKLLPYMTSHPNIGVYQTAEVASCSKCGSTKLSEYGTASTSVSCFKQYKCECCGAFSRGRTNLLTKDKRASLLTSVSGQ